MEKVVAIYNEGWSLTATNLGVSSYCCCCRYSASTEKFEILAWDKETENLKWTNVYGSFGDDEFVPINYKMENSQLLQYFYLHNRMFVSKILPYKQRYSLVPKLSVPKSVNLLAESENPTGMLQVKLIQAVFPVKQAIAHLLFC